MSGYLICIDKESGVPIFSRRLGDVEQMDFSKAAALNGVRVFGKAQGVELLSALTGSAKFVWKDFRDRITLIYGGTEDSRTDLHVERFLENVFYILAFHVGLKNLLQPPSLDQLRKQLRLAYPSVDKLLHGLSPTEPTMYFSDLCGCVEVQLHAFQAHKPGQQLLDSIVQNLGVLHGVLFNGCSVVATTSQWTEICIADRIFIGLATQAVAVTFAPKADIHNNVRELPVFLPKSDPDTPLRLIVISCSETLRISLLCGRSPPISDIREESSKILRNHRETLSQLNLSACSLPARKLFNAHHHCQGFLARNIHDRLCGFAIFPDHDGNGNGDNNRNFSTSISSSSSSRSFAGSSTSTNNAGGPFPHNSNSTQNRATQKLEALRLFFRNTVPDFFPWIMGGKVTSTAGCNNTSSSSSTSIKCKETYWSSEYYKCHAVRSGPYQLFAMYDATTTMPIMRKSTWELCRDVFRDRAIK